MLRLLVLVGVPFTSSIEKTEQFICFEKKVKHNTCVDRHDGKHYGEHNPPSCIMSINFKDTRDRYDRCQSGGEHDGEHNPPGAGDGGGKSLLLELEILLHQEGHSVCHSVEDREGTSKNTH